MFSAVQNQDEWDQLVNESAYNHPLQLWGWGELKKVNGWRPLRLKGSDGFGAQILLKKIPKLNLYLAYCPRGPICPPDVLAKNIPELKKYLEQQKVISLRIEPSYLAEDVKTLGLKTTKNKILMNKTLQIDLDGDIASIKSRMSSSVKNNINKSLRLNTILPWNEVDNFIDVFYEMYSDTALRAGFKIQKKEYYQAIIDNLGDAIDIQVVFDESGTVPLCFLWNIFSKDITIELYAGISKNMDKNSKANYGLKFRAVEQALNRGSLIYDFNGRLEGGVEAFKRQFGPKEVDFLETQQINISIASRAFSWVELVLRKIK